MQNRLKNWIAISLLPQILLVKWLGSYPGSIESWYSNSMYPLVSRFFRGLLGWIPFSVGDLAYMVLFVLLLRYIYLNTHKRSHYKIWLRDIVMVFSIAYFSFHLSWGLNYYREPLAEQLGLEEKYTTDELAELTERLIAETNRLQFEITSDTTLAVEFPYSQKQIFEMTLNGYRKTAKEYPELVYLQPSIKTSLFSTLLSFMGYGGYLNPFTHEAQVNDKIPDFRFPVVTAHEIGHQLGYSAENEANFIGYLVTLSHGDTYFRYSGTAYAAAHCLNTMKKRDKARFQYLYDSMHPGVLANYEELKQFWEKYANPLEPVFKSIFNTFLKVNNQKSGIRSYNLVVSLMVAYHKDHPL